MNLQMMIGKIKRLNFKALFSLITFSLLITSYYFNNYTFIGIYILFFLISFYSTKNGLKVIKSLKLLQNIREDGPALHFSKKNTPTAGGVFLVTPFLILLLIIFINSYSIKILLLLFSIFGFFIIGLLDDFLSIKNQNNTGLKVNEKFIFQSIVATVFIGLAYATELIYPSISITNTWEINSNLMIIPISFFTLVGLSNSVNLTDGLDGLATGCSSIVFFGLGTEILLKEREEFIIFSVLCYAMSGLCVGFLKFNRYPAKIFMGDTGSLSIGATIGSISILTNSFLIIFIMSGIFLVESISVIIQVTFFKFTKKFLRDGKRIFLMTPLHHHFELMGVKEEKIVENFWKINILLVIFGIVLKIIL